jgi:hypothetical protein
MQKTVNSPLCSTEDVSGGGAVSPQTQPIEFQSCIPAPWINGLLKKVFQRRIIRKFNLAKKFYPFIRSARIEIQFRVVLAQRVLGETGVFLFACACIFGAHAFPSVRCLLFFR